MGSFFYMPVKFHLLPSLLLAACAVAHGESLTVDEQTFDFGESYQFAEVQHDIEVWNRSDHAVELKAIDGSTPGLHAEFDQATLAPGKSAKLHIRFGLEDRVGSVAVSYPFAAEQNGKSERYLVQLTGFVDSILDTPKPSLQFGTVDEKAPHPQTIKLTSADHPDFKIARVLQAPDFVDVRIEGGQSLIVTPKASETLGLKAGFVKVALTSPLQPAARIGVQMDLHGNVVPDQNPLNFDLQHPSALRTVRLQLTSRDGKPFQLGKSSLEGGAHIDIQEAACLPAERPDCHALLLKLRKDQPHGILKDTLLVDLPKSHHKLEVRLGGLFFGDDVKVRSIEEEAQKGATTSKATPNERVDLHSALHNAVAPVDDAVPAGEGPLLKWSVANEAGIYGYAIFRGDTEDGPFQRVNPNSIVRAHNEGDNSSAKYQWRDTSAKAATEYWYYISIFYNDGRKQQLTGPQKVLAK